MEGVKKVEFRKRPFGRTVSHVVVYSSSPVKRVLGWFEVGGIDEATPAELWGRYSSVGGIERKEYEQYFASSERAVAIHVGRRHVLQQPIPLDEVLPSGRAPQSYAYLADEAASMVFRQR